MPRRVSRLVRADAAAPGRGPDPGRRTAWWALIVAAVVLVVGVGLKVSCLGADGLTRGEAALGWCYSDVVALAQQRGLATTPTPYVDVMTEYPPLTALQWVMAGLVSRTAQGFYLATAALQVLAWLLVVWLIAGEGTRPCRLLIVAAVPALALTATVNWDPVALLGLTAGLVAARRDHPAIAGIALGAGGLAKVFPLLAVPVLAWSWWRRGHRRSTVHFLIAVAATVAAVQVPVALLAPEGWDVWLTLNTHRPVDWDTLWYGLQVVTGQVLPGAVANVAVGVATLWGWVVIVAIARRRSVPTESVLVALLAWLLVAGKVHSPQFSLWLLPLLALTAVDWRLVAAWALADVVVVLTRFPFLAGQQGLEPSLEYAPFGIAVAVRSLALVGVMAAALTPPEGRPSTPSPAPPRPAVPG